MLFVQYMQNNDLSVAYEAIDKPAFEANGHIDVLKAALNHERYVTGLIHNIYGAASDKKRFPYYAVFRLVCKRTRRRGNKCRRSGQKNGTFWFRSKEPISVRSGNGDPYLCCAITCIIRLWNKNQKRRKMQASS